MKCPFCDSLHTLKDGFDNESMDIWRCMACGETFTQADLDKAEKGDNDGDKHENKHIPGYYIDAMSRDNPTNEDPY